MVYADGSEILDFDGVIDKLDSFNLPIAKYCSGSYFGDNDFFKNSK
jgi:hypothetical protein